MAEIEYLDQGVTVSPAIPSPGDIVEVRYGGLLANSGADKVYARVGFDLGWENSAELEMNKASNGFWTTVEIYPNYSTFNVCFKDSVGNWDNNSGENYSFLLGRKSQAGAKK